MSGSINIKKIKIGGTLRLVLKQTAGDFASVTSVTSDMKRTEHLNEVPPAAEPVVASLTVTSDADESSWYITLPALESANITPGDYAVDVKIMVGSEVDHTDTLFVRFGNSVT